MRRKVWAVRPLMILAFVLLLVGSGSASAGCVAVSGTFVNEQVYPPACTSPVLLCTHGDLDGDLEADYDFTMTSLAPGLDLGRPQRFVFTGESTITLVDGVMAAEDTGWLDYNPVGLSSFETTVNIVSGTGAYAGAQGALVATGALDLSTGQGSGTYTGTVCV